MQLKKILAAGAMGAVMIGSTIAMAATASDLSNYPAPFISGGTANTLVVVGATAATADVVGAVDLAARLGGQTTTDYTCTGSSGGASVTGEGKAVATTNTNLYLGDYLRKTGVRYTMTSTDMPTALASGVVTDTDASTTYTYDQYIDLSNDYIVKYDNAKTPPNGVTADPVVKLYDSTNSGTVMSPPSTSDYLYRARVVFNKEVNLTTAISSGATLDIFGNSYTFSSGTTITGTNTAASTDKLVLFGASDTRILNGGDTVTVTIGGTSYDVTFQGATSTNTAVIRVGSSQDSITQGSSKEIGGLTVFANKVWQFSTTDQKQNQVKLGIGAQTLTFQHGQRVYTGTGTANYIDGTLAQIGLSNGKMTTLDIYVSGPKSVYDALTVGNSLVDPVFKSFSLNFASLTPDLKSSAKDLIQIAPSGDTRMAVTFTDYSGKSATVNYVYNTTSGGFGAILADASGFPIQVKEGAAVKLNEYFVANAGDYPHIFQLTNLNNDGTSTGSIELTDKFSGTAYTITMGTALATTKVFDGQTYYVSGTGSTQNTSVKFYWGDSASLTSVGADTTIYPTIRAKNGEYVAFTNRTILTLALGNNLVTLPTGVLNISMAGAGGTYDVNTLTFSPYSSSYSVSADNMTGWNSTAVDNAVYVGKTTTGGLYYNLTRLSNTSLAIQVRGISTSTTALQAPSLILLEEQEKDSANTYTVLVPSSSTVISSVSKVMAGTPAFTDTGRDTADFISDSYKTGYLDKYGVYAELANKNAQYTLNIYYPDDQMTADFFVLGKDGAVSTSGATAGTTYQVASPIKTSIAKLDSEVSDADKQTKNIILVGGPCVNTLVATLATAGKFDYSCANWPGENFALIKLVDDAFITGKTALVIAGTRAADSRDATTALQQFDVAPYAGKLTGTKVKVVGTAITVA